MAAQPLPPALALRQIRRARVEQELVAGHRDLRFVGLLTVSAPTPAELDAACAATESAAAQSMCEILRLVGQQGQAFAAAAVPLARRVS